MDDNGPDLEDLDDATRALLDQLDAVDATDAVVVQPHDQTIGLVPTDVRQIDQSVPVEMPLPVVQNDKATDVKKHFEQLSQVTDEILRAAVSDRQETQDAINLMHNQINQAISNNSQPARMYLDNWVKALEVKAAINTTVVKIMEVNAKFLAATKAGGVNINNNLQQNNATLSGGNDPALIELLANNELGSEDEY